MNVQNPFAKESKPLELPNNIRCYSMIAPDKLADIENQILNALKNPIGTESFDVVAKAKLDKNPQAKAAIVISDNTRPVPYKGKQGILMPLINTLLKVGYNKKNITVVIGNGTHKPMAQSEIEKIVDEEVFKNSIAVINHDCKDSANLKYIGKTKRGSEVIINSTYMEADLKIVTGLVESHFMAGCSGGRKSVCPGVISEEGTFIFHSAELMGHPQSRDLNLEGNPVHEESLEFAKMAGVDFIVNVTLDHSFDITGVFAGDLEKAHLAAVEKIKSYVKINVEQEADIVITQAGFVGINHYQSAKAAFASIGAMKKDGYLISIADFTDQKDTIGSAAYKVVLGILALSGADALVKTLYSKDWKFIPDQWQVQKWASVFQKIPQDHYYYFARQITDTKTSAMLPGINAADLFEKKDFSLDDLSLVINACLEDIYKKEGRNDLSILWLNDGPYAIPYV